MDRKPADSTLAIGLLLCLWLSFFSRTTFVIASDSSSDVTVHFIDVGHGDSIFIDTSDKDVLIDGGSSSKGPEVLEYLDTLSIIHIHLMIATHVHADHIGGLVTVLESALEVDEILINNQTYYSGIYEEFMNLTQSHNVTAAHRGQTIVLTETANLTIFNPTQPLEFPGSGHENDNSVVAKLQAGSVSFLLTGDAEEDAEQSMMDAGLDLQSDVLKVGHHGSDTSTTQSFLDSVNPSYAIISALGGDRPDNATIDKLLAANVTAYGTYLSGTIVVSTNGTSITFHDDYQVIPEFPPSMILPLFMIVTLIAVAFFRRKKCIREDFWVQG